MNHEKLECYQSLIEVARRLSISMKRWPRGYGYLKDQLHRALSSSILNLAEGNGKRGYHMERRRFFQISLGSISEVAACLDIACIFSLISESQSTELKDMLRASYCKIRMLP